jgi:hypothetical protein
MFSSAKPSVLRCGVRSLVGYGGLWLKTEFCYISSFVFLLLVRIKRDLLSCLLALWLESWVNNGLALSPFPGRSEEPQRSISTRKNKTGTGCLLYLSAQLRVDSQHTA